MLERATPLHPALPLLAPLQSWGHYLCMYTHMHHLRPHLQSIFSCLHSCLRAWAQSSPSVCKLFFRSTHCHIGTDTCTPASIRVCINFAWTHRRGGILVSVHTHTVLCWILHLDADVSSCLLFLTAPTFTATTDPMLASGNTAVCRTFANIQNNKKVRCLYNYGTRANPKFWEALKSIILSPEAKVVLQSASIQCPIRKQKRWRKRPGKFWKRAKTNKVIRKIIYGGNSRMMLSTWIFWI